MKFYLIICVFILFVLLAIFVYFRYYFHHQLFKDLVGICKHLKNSISFKKEKIDNLLNEAYLHIHFVSRNLLKNNTNTSFLFKKEDLDIARKFVSSLGKGDVDWEMNNLGYFENDFEQMEKTSKELLQKNGVMYLKIIIGVGLAVCIMLL